MHLGRGVNKVSNRTRLLIALTLILILVSSIAPAQQEMISQAVDEQRPAPTTLRTTTRLVLIDAVVTDSAGNPVPGLKASDFSLLEDGKAQEIRGFSYHQSKAIGSESTSPEGPRVPSSTTNETRDVYSNSGITDPAQDLTVIVLDELNTDVLQSARACQETVQYLQSAAHGRSFAVYVLHNYLRVVKDVTNLPSEAATALIRYGKEHSRSISHAEHLKIVSESADVSEESIRSQREVTQTEADLDKNIGDSRIRITLEALLDVARAASGIPGRKKLIWISSGFPLYLREGDGGPITSYEQLLHSVTNALADAQIAVYPIDPRGLSGPAMIDFGFTGTAKSGSLLRGNAIGSAIESRELELLPVHETMDRIADSTGGKATYSANFLSQAINRASRDGLIYYTLGYYPTNQNWDGGFREVKIKVATKPHFDIRARSGYFATAEIATPNEASRQRAENELVRSLRIGAPEMRTLPFVARVTDRENNGRLRITYFVPPKALSFGAVADRMQQGDIEYAVRIYDPRGSQVAAHAGTFHSELNVQQFAQADKELLTFNQDFALPSGTFLLKVGVMDMRNGRLGTLSFTRHIARAAPHTLQRRQDH